MQCIEVWNVIIVLLVFLVSEFWCILSLEKMKRNFKFWINFVCFQAFKYPDQLNRHRLEHTLAQKFACTICDKQFVRSYELRNHMRNYHSGFVYVCGVCHECCAHRHTIIRHYKRKVRLALLKSHTIMDKKCNWGVINQTYSWLNQIKTYRPYCGLLVWWTYGTNRLTTLRAIKETRVKERFNSRFLRLSSSANGFI